MHFSKKSGRLSSAGPEILAFGSYCSAKFQLILDCFIPKFKFKYEDSENITNRLCRYSRFQTFFWDTWDDFPNSTFKALVCLCAIIPNIMKYSFLEERHPLLRKYVATSSQGKN